MIMVMAADHGGYELKNAIKKHLQERGGFQILDLGTNDGEAVDYLRKRCRNINSS